ncbi:MAG TPA: glycosyltransferase [Candidatus Limnocylindrales bacterium]|nr:glycosyltransferase [Candidatus Limnocylindrales bacterium]
MTDAHERRRRAVILVGGPANPYSRAIRLGRTLAGLGYEVEIAATAEPGAPAIERDGPLTIHRYGSSGVFRSVKTAARWFPATDDPARRPPLPVRLVRGLRRATRQWRTRSLRWLLWPYTVRDWWHTLAAELEPADLYHSCGALPIAAAIAARERDRRAGRRSRVILDVIDISLESNNVLDVPRPILWLLRRRERNWARAADAHTAINDAFADRAMALWRLPRRPTVVPNYPEPWAPASDEPAPDRIRAALGLPPSTRICLFWGRLGPNLGLDEMADAVLRVPDAVLVLLGFARGWADSVARDEDPRYRGRHFTLPAVHPDELAAWVASADVGLITLPPVSFNQRHTTPNKFLESMMAGTPMVLGPDLPTMAAILEREDLGRIAASMAPADIAAAIMAILDRPPTERAEWRASIAAIARARYSWPIAAAAYAGLVESLTAGGSA